MRGGSRKRSHWVKDRVEQAYRVWRGGGLAGISPFMLGWTLGMLTGYSANLVRARSHADTGKAGLDRRVREKISWG